MIKNDRNPFRKFSSLSGIRTRASRIKFQSFSHYVNRSVTFILKENVTALIKIYICYPELLSYTRAILRILRYITWYVVGSGFTWVRLARGTRAFTALFKWFGFHYRKWIVSFGRCVQIAGIILYFCAFHVISRVHFSLADLKYLCRE